MNWENNAIILVWIIVPIFHTLQLILWDQLGLKSSYISRSYDLPEEDQQSLKNIHYKIFRQKKTNF